MTASELITALQKMPPDLEVMFSCEFLEEPHAVDIVQIDKEKIRYYGESIVMLSPSSTNY